MKKQSLSAIVGVAVMAVFFVLSGSVVFAQFQLVDDQGVVEGVRQLDKKFDDYVIYDGVCYACLIERKLDTSKEVSYEKYLQVSSLF